MPRTRFSKYREESERKRPRLTNRLGLPQPIYDAVANDDYDPGDSQITVTQLLSPPRQVRLIQVWPDAIEEDVADRIWSLLGQSVHTILERADTTGITEQRLYTDVLGWKVSGRFDRIAAFDEVMQDYKTASVYEVKSGIREEREQQLNLLAHLARLAGYEIEKLQAVFILRDWSKRRAARERGYPGRQVVVFEIPVWSETRCLEFLEQRVRMHQEAVHVLPHCTDEDRWISENVWAVRKPQNKKAMNGGLHDTPEGAADWAAKNAPLDFKIDFRPGESVRCESYCLASQVCEQWAGIERAESADQLEAAS